MLLTNPTPLITKSGNTASHVFSVHGKPTAIIPTIVDEISKAKPTRRLFNKLLNFLLT
jgi:hypothetical protein